jgi:hypothetical protein
MSGNPSAYVSEPRSGEEVQSADLTAAIAAMGIVLGGATPDVITPAAAPLPAGEQNVFILARQIELILQGQSNKTCMKVMNMVGSLHGIRSIPIDRPIGQSTTGTKKVVPVATKPPRGLPTPKAAWKQSDDYRRLSAERDSVVTTIKSLTPNDPAKQDLVQSLRTIELSLKNLKARTAGDQ